MSKSFSTGLRKSLLRPSQTSSSKSKPAPPFAASPGLADLQSKLQVFLSVTGSLHFKWWGHPLAFSESWIQDIPDFWVSDVISKGCRQVFYSSLIQAFCLFSLQRFDNLHAALQKMLNSCIVLVSSREGFQGFNLFMVPKAKGDIHLSWTWMLKRLPS